MSFPPTGIKCSSETAIFRNVIDEKDEGYCLPSGVVSEPSSPIKGTFRNKNNVTRFHGRGVISSTRIEGGGNCIAHRHLTRHMELIKAVFPQKCYEESPSYLNDLVTRKGKVRIQGSEFPLRVLREYNIKIYCGQGNKSDAVGGGKFGTVIPFKLHDISTESISFVFKTESKTDSEKFIASFNNPPENLKQLYPLKGGFLQAPLRAKLAFDLAKMLKLSGRLACTEIGLNNHREFGTLMAEIKGVNADVHLRTLRNLGHLGKNFDLRQADLKTLLRLGVIDELVYSESVLLDYLWGRHDRSKLTNVMVEPLEMDTGKANIKLIDMDLCFPAGNDSLDNLYCECHYHRDRVVDLMIKAVSEPDSGSELSSGEGLSLAIGTMTIAAKKQEDTRDQFYRLLKGFGEKLERLIGEPQQQAFIERVKRLKELMTPIPTAVADPAVHS
ncbi:hypothetical protein [Endozoicomonas sp.]|uniref:hypothetical protein n=1 Tax=Endozoicomonas sp. TaxID=1892382 RepID=UPI003AF4A383